MQNANEPQRQTRHASSLGRAGHSLFDEPLPAAVAANLMPESVLPPELTQLSSGGAETAVALPLLKTLAQRALAAFPTSPPLPRHIDLYVAMGALQKAIRIGNIPLAISASRWLIEKGFAAANWKRLRTIAVEDIGLGDPEVAAFVVWLAARKDLHAQLGHFNLSV